MPKISRKQNKQKTNKQTNKKKQNKLAPDAPTSSRQEVKIRLINKISHFYACCSDIFTNLKMRVPGLASLNFYESWSEFMSPTWRLSEIMLCG